MIPAITNFANYLSAGPNVTDISAIAPTETYQNVLGEGILGALNRQDTLNQGSFTRGVQAQDYGGFKIGESFKKANSPAQFASLLPTQMPKELLNIGKTILGNPVSNIANTLGDYTFEYEPPAYDFDDDYMGISDRYNFPTTSIFPGSPFNINAEIKNKVLKNKIRNKIFELQNKGFEKNQQKKAAQQIQQVQQNIQTYGNRDRPNEGINTPGGGKGQSPTGGDVAGTPFVRGGRASYFDGGLLSLWPR